MSFFRELYGVRNCVVVVVCKIGVKGLAHAEIPTPFEGK